MSRFGLVAENFSTIAPGTAPRERDTMKRMAMIAALTGCSSAWEIGSAYHLEIEGDTGVSMEEWKAKTLEAERIWDEANGPGCPFPFRMVDCGDACGSRPVVLVADRLWEGSSTGWQDYGVIRVRVTPDLPQIRATLLHEFGHAFGLEHSDNRRSLMDSHRTADITVPNAADGWSARAALGCGS